ncbi:MAG TPA: nitrilase-related carbon-nitrogen hydrolase, partial [Polyangiaceae bacterium]|nr:nitrilase-related carbon-nitrogen hydrolase [Polyangiaceae bacterium]
MLVRIALAQLPYPSTPDDAVERVVRAMRLASNAGVAVIAFPECYVPGYRGLGRAPPAPDAAFLER